MKKSTLLLSLILLIAVSLQSCLEITEKLIVNKDGSGTFSMSIDMSELKSMMEGLSEGEETESSSPFENMEEGNEEIISRLREIDGISEVKILSENEGYMVTTKFDFKTISALNRGMDVVYESETTGETEYYKMTKKSFERTAANSFLEKMKNDLASSNEEGGEDMDLSEYFADSKFINKVVFNDLKIKKVKSGNVEVSEDGTTLVNSYLIYSDEADQTLEFELKMK